MWLRRWRLDRISSPGQVSPRWRGGGHHHLHLHLTAGHRVAVHPVVDLGRVVVISRVEDVLPVQTLAAHGARPVEPLVLGQVLHLQTQLVVGVVAAPAVEEVLGEDILQRRLGKG